jgi:outer membrane beta-barrel protein
MLRTASTLLSCALLALTCTVSAQDDDAKKPVKIIEPNKSAPQLQAAAIDTEKFELGVYTGLLSIEDFNTNVVTGIAFNYHLSKRFIAQATYGKTEVDQAAFETIANGKFLSDYDFTYIDLVLGYKIFDGRSFMGKRHKYNSALYFMGGAADVSFADNNETGLVLGTSYRTVITDWMTFNIDIRNTTLDMELIGVTRKTNNTELNVGLNALF